MDLLLVAARVGLALVFVVAGIGKLLDPQGSRRALRDFGVPARWLQSGGWMLPVFELAAAAALLAQPVARLGALLALTLLVVFIIGIAYALRQGRAPDCHCFGQLQSSPAGRATIVRNIALAAVAALVLVAGPGEAFAGAGATGSALVAISAVAVTLSIGLFALLRERQRLMDPTGGMGPLDLGTPAPDLRLRDAGDKTLKLSDILDRERPSVLVFVAPSCGPCASLMPRLELWRSALAERVSIILISSPPPEGGPTVGIPTATAHTMWDIERAAMRSYRIQGTPSAILVDQNGAVASAPVMASEGIEALIRVARRPRLPAGVRRNQPQRAAV